MLQPMDHKELDKSYLNNNLITANSSFSHPPGSLLKPASSLSFLDPSAGGGGSSSTTPVAFRLYFLHHLDHRLALLRVI